MKSTGIIRKVDDLGRVVLPAELRRSLEIKEQDEVEIFVEGNQIILQKFSPCCVFCGGNERLASYYGKNLCKDCIANIQKY